MKHRPSVWPTQSRTNAAGMASERGNVIQLHHLLDADAINGFGFLSDCWGPKLSRLYPEMHGSSWIESFMSTWRKAG